MEAYMISALTPGSPTQTDPTLKKIIDDLKKMYFKTNFCIPHNTISFLHYAGLFFAGIKV